ncbi:related to selenoprotein domain protein [Saccharomycodes ludwigii]|uniref:Related to selenoprotein domain protein n=1 Tax=Saccharomycodes ludwigii TaxID=36035 RepID=A0A376B6N1_9ASCO|nr:hypothetical protein SCDLUD_000865 [Saccharomycodes ludwigii]KAH3903244.1 hypothetical protein SCDLUD_000865 [Saccharomycodes ludwigii]SSD60302.1 related to selenoprotein domain protein [Saccharomycodes ludwigii]
MTDISSVYPKVSIEFCNKCKWGLRSFWYQQELLQTFDDKIKELSLKPRNDQPGIFLIKGYFYIDTKFHTVVLWDRKIDGGFPDAKTLKQRIKKLLFNEKIDIGKHNDGCDTVLGKSVVSEEGIKTACEDCIGK